ncbi:hypothetical protein [Breoghania sp. L-A4]|uniref:hypothetical protein n=1 Tax=Breoghania sp. L-A4 TaxID=2304600 RepID=UPI0013C2EEB5|nr:hypothetical protein [Breoghania sp. L-A4]
MSFTFEIISSIFLLPKLLFDIVISPRKVSLLAVAEDAKAWDKSYSTFAILVVLSVLFFGLSLLENTPALNSGDMGIEFPKIFGFSGRLGAPTFWAMCILAVFYLLISISWLLFSSRSFNRENVTYALRISVLVCFVFLTFDLVEDLFFAFRLPAYSLGSIFHDTTQNWQLRLTSWKFWVGRLVLLWALFLFFAMFVWSVLEARYQNSNEH